MQTDLAAGGKLDAASARVLTGVVEKNDLSAAGIVTNQATVAVRFKLADAQRTRYEKTISVNDEWESSFMGAIAIPRAIQNYVVSIQKLIGKLFADPEFAAATAP